MKNREHDYNPIIIMGLFIYIYTILLLLSLSLLSLSLLSLLLLLFIYIYMLYPLKVDDLGYPAKLVYKWLN